MSTADLQPIMVTAHVDAPLSRTWALWTDPEAVCQWNAASDDWHTPRAENDLRVGGTFSFRMEAKDGSQGFDLEGTYTEVLPQAALAYVLEDGRKVSVRFEAEGAGTRVTEVFDPEGTYPPEFQRAGWQAILDNFARFAATP